MRSKILFITLNDPAQEAEVMRRLAGLPGVAVEPPGADPAEPLADALDQLHKLLTSGPDVTEEDYQAFCAKRKYTC